MNQQHADVAIIGAGPSGAIASALLVKRGYSVRVIERQQFPRFSIGESLLAHCLDFVEEAGMSAAVHKVGFQFKNGAAFVRGHEYTDFNFADKYSKGYAYTFQVPRATFDSVLANEAAKQGADIRYQEEIVGVDFSGEKPRMTVQPKEGDRYEITSRFVLDGSGFGRTLPRMLKLDTPSDLAVRRAYFTHIEDHVEAKDVDRQKILVTVHPENRDVWFWLIPFSNGRSSVGVVGPDDFLEKWQGTPEDRLKAIIAATPTLKHVLRNAVFDTPVNELRGYSANVKAMHGNGFALLGNAAEFLDPVFSSGVTIAMKSASMAVGVLDKQLKGAKTDWETEFAAPLKKGVDAFRTYVNAWYDGRFQTVLFAANQDPEIKAKICSVLAGYAWDETNPFVAQSERRLNALYEYCKRSASN